MDLPLPNEVLTDIFAHLQDSMSTLKALCLVSRGFAHVARPFLYSSLPLPFLRIRFRDRPGSGLVLDPAAYARFKAVTSDEASVSLKRAVKVVRMSGGGERAGRREYPERLDWTPQNVLATLLEKCDNLHGLQAENPLPNEVVEALDTLPSNPRLTHLFLPDPITASGFQRLVGNNSTLASLSLLLPTSSPHAASLATLDKFPPLPSLVNLTLLIQHSGRNLSSCATYLSTVFFNRTRLPLLAKLDVHFLCPGSWCCGFWRTSWRNSSPQMHMVGALPRLCKEAGVTLLVEGREVPEV